MFCQRAHQVAPLDAASSYLALQTGLDIRFRPSPNLASAVEDLGSGIERPSQLRGRRFAFGDEKALLQRAAVASLGLDMGDFSAFAYLKHYDNIAKAVLAGDFDGGILKDSVADAFKDKGLVVIGSTAPLPAYVFAVHPSLPAATRKKLRQAFLALNKNPPARAAVLEALDSHYDGFTPIDDKAYDSVRRLIRPFQNPAPISAHN